MDNEKILVDNENMDQVLLKHEDDRSNRRSLKRQSTSRRNFTATSVADKTEELNILEAEIRLLEDSYEAGEVGDDELYYSEVRKAAVLKQDLVYLLLVSVCEDGKKLRDNIAAEHKAQLAEQGKQHSDLIKMLFAEHQQKIDAKLDSALETLAASNSNSFPHLLEAEQAPSINSSSVFSTNSSWSKIPHVKPTTAPSSSTATLSFSTSQYQYQKPASIFKIQNRKRTVSNRKRTPAAQTQEPRPDWDQSSVILPKVAAPLSRRCRTKLV